MDLNKILNENKKIGIAGHTSPDGDCIGSSLGLYNYIKENYPDVDVFLFLEDIPKVFSFLNRSDEIINPKNYKPSRFDCFFSLDCADKLRLGDSIAVYKKSDIRYCIDHHISNEAYADENYIVPDASSTSELVFNLMDKDKISKSVAECLYVGIVHDTGSFQYQSTSKDTMNAAGFLMDKGIDYSWIIEKTFYEKTYIENRLLGLALLNSKLYDDEKIIVSVIKKNDFDSVGADKKDTEGIVSQLRITKECDVAVLLYENLDKTFKASLRSSGDIDVSKIAVLFGGGGHVKAAGANVGKNVNEAIDKIIQMVKVQR